MRVQHFGLAALATCFLVQSVHAWNSVGYYTHEALAHDGLYSLPTNDYPDLIKFEAALKDGSESEAGHPGGAFSDEIGGDVAAIWTGNSDLLPGGVLKNFSEKSFVEAYTNIGRIVHLTQDQAVPAHAANIAHSWLHWDDFETYADDHYLVHRINGYSYAFPQQYYAPQQNDTRGKLAGWRKPSTNEQYWVPGADMTVRGHYGGPDGEDIYYNGTYPAIWGVESPEIVGTQNWQGVRNTAGVFAAASRKLPPLIKDLAHTTVSPTIQNPMSIMFGAMENRTQTVRLTAKILKSDGVDTNKKAFDAHPIQLDPGTYLPWEKQVSVQWNGTPTDGSILDYGEYTLELFLADADENESPHASIGFRLVKPGTPSLTIHDNDGGESQSDPFYGDANTPETAPWLHNDFSVDPISGITFVAENDDGLRWFYLGTSDLNPATAFLNTELDLRHLVVETRILPDKEGYAVAAWGATDERTKVNFGVDSLPPELAFNVHVKPDFTVWLKGEVKDKTSGVAEIRYAQIQGVPQKYDELPGTGSPMSRLIDQEVVPAQQNEWGRYAFLHVSAGDRAGLASTGSVVSYYSSRSGNVSWNVNKETSPEWFSFPSGGFGNRLFGARRESACVRRSGSLPEQCNADPPPPSSCGSLAFRVKTESSPDPGEPKPGAIEIISEVPSSETTIFDAALGVDDRTVDLELPLGPAVWFQLALTDANSNPCYEPTATVGIDLETMSGTAETNPAQGPLPSGTDIAVTADGATFELARVEPGPNNHFMVLRDDDPVPPVGYKRLCGVNPARDFTTGAIYSGSLTATFLIDAPCLTQSQFSRIRMFHMVAGSWTDITSSVNVANRTVQGVDDHASWFGVFISTSILFNDAHAPTSQITYSTYPMTPASGGIWISTDTLLTLTAADPVIEGEASSGVEGLYYLLDQQFISRAETPGTRYEAPFTLEGGTRTLTFYAADGAGNVESAHRLDLVSYEHASQLPGSLWVSARSSTAVELSWQQNGNPPNAGYGLAYGSTGGSMSCDLDSGVFTQNQPSIRPALRIGGLLPMTPYAFSICALGIQGNCGASVVVQTSPAEQVGDEPSPSFVACGTGGGPSGLALSADSTGNLWEIVSDDSSIRLGKFDAAGAQVASVNLPGANEEGRWTIRFDPEGNAYAVGGASSGAEEGLQRVAVYKVASSGDVLLSSTVFENPWGLNDFAFDSTGDIWITGAVQTSGPPDFSGPVGIAMGLWRFEPATGQLSLKASYAGDSGFDAGFGVQLDGSGAIWVVGFSSMAASTSPNKLALALWKYDATGTNLLAGPFLRHGYMRDIEQDVNARLLASGDDLWVTATKTSAVGNLDLALVRYGLDGALKSEKFWHSDSGGDELPTSILVGRNGAITVAGGTGAGANELAVWRHTSEGVLEWASTMAGAGRANGMVYSGGMWLAAAGAGTPLKFTPGASLAGGEGTDAGGLDVLAPRTTVQIGEPKTPGDPVVVSTATLFSLSAEDDLAVVGDNLGIGVSEIHFLVDVTRESCEGVTPDPSAQQGTCANPVYSQPFTLSPGLHTVYYSAMDLAGHEEPIGSFRATAAEVSVDTTPPVVGLLSPSPLAEGISQLFSGVVQVIGTATDEHLASYSLKLSAGESFDPESNTTISQATVPVELGILGLLDTAAVEPGTYTLRLEARDLSGNSSVLDARMYLDVLGVDLVIGQTPGLNHPEGVASGPLGRVWVADTNNDSLRVFEADGALAGTYSGLGLNKPQGLAFDGESFWLADTNNDRVVKLSTGGAILASYGKPGKSSGFVPGAGLGEFNKPSAVAVSAEGAVFVADMNNSRVQVLEEGAWRVIPLSAPLGGVSSEPAGLALDQDNNLLVSDQANSRVLKLDPAGNLLSTFGSYGALPGQFDKPQGIAVSASGFVFVADRNNDRIQKFDRFGHVVALLGQSGKEPGQFNKPSSLALDAEGRLLVADSNNGRIQRLLPGSPSPAVVMVGKPKKVKQPVSDKGGKVKHPEGYKLDIPEGALAVQTAITIEPVTDPSLGLPAKTGQGKEALKGASEVLDLGPEGTRFSAPVLVSVPYDPKALGGMAENDLKLFTWNTQSLAWEKVEKSWVSVSSRAVFALLEHFSLYQVMGIQPEATTSSDFNFRDVYAFPNPARGVNPTFRAQVGTAESVDITIYDSAGKIVEKDSCGTGQVKDLGNGMGNQLTFECVWDAHRVGSGVYTYMLRARKAGFKDVTVVKKVGLIK